MKDLERGNKVRLIGRHNPYRGELGKFIRHEKLKLEKDRLIVLLNSDEKQHYFYADEVTKV